MKITKGLIEQHIHGAFGIDFMTCDIDELLYCADLLAQNGVCAFFPTVMTDDLDVIKNRIEIIKEAQSLQNQKTAKISGIHLEGPFINPSEAGIHEKKFILPLDIELYKKIHDDIIKIVTIAPELDMEGSFRKYLNEKGIKISAGHTQTIDFNMVHQITHLYNAMSRFHHRNITTAVKALVNDDIYTEIIADSVHVSDDVLKITFKQKPLNKIILISDALPLAHSNITEAVFAGQKIYNQNGNLINKDGTIAGSSGLLCDIVKNLADKQITSFDLAIQCASSNIINYHCIQNNIDVYWDENNKIQRILFN